MATMHSLANRMRSLSPAKRASLFRLLSFWPPYFFSGIRVKKVAPDFRTVEVTMGLHWYNTNYVGTQFGGTLYAMCDPFFMFILLENLGPNYIVWDKAASIRFRKPGRGRVHAKFHIPDARIEEIRQAADRDPKVEPSFQVSVTDDQGQVIAEVEKLLYVKRKGAK